MTSRRWVERLLTPCLVALSCAASSAVARDSIVWAVLDFPPFQILDGEFRNTGSFDGLLEVLIRELPEFDHQVVPMTFARREEEIRQGHRLCTPGLFRTPAREKLVTFSMPALVHLDNRLVFLAGNEGRMGIGTSVDLASVLKRTDLIAGIVSGRSFAPNIDPVLRRFAQSPNVVMRPIKSWQIFELLLSGDIDYTILFPHEVAYLVRQHGATQPLAIRPIAGTPSHIFTHVACTKGEWGEATVAHIDRIIAAHRKQPEYRALSERWYEESDRALIRKYYPNLLAPAGATP